MTQFGNAPIVRDDEIDALFAAPPAAQPQSATAPAVPPVVRDDELDSLFASMPANVVPAPAGGEVDPGLLRFAQENPDIQVDFSGTAERTTPLPQLSDQPLSPERDEVARITAAFDRFNTNVSPEVVQQLEGIDDSLLGVGRELGLDEATTRQLLAQQDGTELLTDAALAQREASEFRQAIEAAPRPLRPIVSGINQSSLSSASLLARPFEELGLLDEGFSDDLNQLAGATGQARRDIGDQTIAENVVESVTSSLVDMVTLGRVVPPGSVGATGAVARLNQARGLILAFTAKAGNDAITEGRQAGLEGRELATFAAGQAATEGLITSAFSLLGLGGVENAAIQSTLKPVAKEGMKQIALRLGKQSLAELSEENLIMVGQNLNRVLADVDPDALDPEKLQREFVETSLASLLTLGVVETSQSVGSRIAERQAGLGRTQQSPAATATPGIAKAEPTPTTEQTTDQVVDPDAEADVANPADGTNDRRQTTTDVTTERREGRDRRSPDLAAERASIQQLFEEGKTEEAQARITELQDRARRDPKGTGLLSGVTFDQQAADIEADVREGGEPRHIAVLDVANLGLMNTVRGHVDADSKLANIAQAVLDVAGPEASFRTGGDEMGVIFPAGTTPAEAQRLLKEIEAKVGFDEVVPGASVFLAGEIGTITPDTNLKGVLEDIEHRGETKKRQIKADRGEPTSISKDEAARLAQAVRQEAESAPTSPESAAAQRASTDEAVEKLDANTATSIRNKETRAIRNELGLRELEGANAATFQQFRQEALDSGLSEQVPQIAHEVVDTPRALTDVENAAFGLALRARLNAHSHVVKRLESEKDASTIDALLAQRNELEQEIDLITHASNLAGTEAGRALASRQLAIEKDFSLGSILTEAKHVKGEDLTQPERKRIEDKERRHRQADRKANTQQKKINKDDARRQLERRGRKTKISPAELDRQLADLDPADLNFLGKVALNRAQHPAHNKSFESIIAATQAIAQQNGRKGKLPPVVIEDQVLRELATERNDARTKTVDLFRQFKTLTQTRGKLRRDVEQLQDELETGWFEDRPNGKKTTPEVLRTLKETKAALGTERDLQQELAQLQQQLRAPQDALSSPIDPSRPQESDFIQDLRSQIRDKQAEIRLRREIAILETQLENGMFDRPTKKEKQANEVLTDLIARRNVLRLDIQRELDLLKPRQKMATVARWLGIPRSIMASMDASMYGIQGAWNLLSHPVRSLSATPDTVRAAFSEKNAQKALLDMMQSRHFTTFLEAGGQITSTGSDLDAREEAFRSDLAERIPVVGELIKGSNRAYTTFLNILRFRSFEALVNADGGQITPERAEIYADFVNSATGRGSLGPQGSRLNQASGMADIMFFSARNWMSRIDLIRGKHLVRAAMKGDRRAMVVVAREYARVFAGLGVLFGLWELFGGEIETDPLSASFLRMSWEDDEGEVHSFDPSGQLGSELSFWARLFVGKETKRDGERTDLRYPEWGQKDTFDLITRRIRGKLSPVASYTVDAATGEDYVGKPFEPVGDAGARLVPLAGNDMRQAMSAQDDASKITLALLAFFGGRPYVNSEEIDGQWADWAREKQNRRESRKD